MENQSRKASDDATEHAFNGIVILKMDYFNLQSRGSNPAWRGYLTPYHALQCDQTPSIVYSTILSGIPGAESTTGIGNRGRIVRAILPSHLVFRPNRPRHAPKPASNLRGISQGPIPSERTNIQCERVGARILPVFDSNPRTTHHKPPQLSKPSAPALTIQTSIPT
jgi:hypothetical protein